jgi:hypothetical protein
VGRGGSDGERQKGVGGGTFLTKGAEIRFSTRVARWFIFKTKSPNLGIFWRALDIARFYKAVWYNL